MVASSRDLIVLGSGPGGYVAAIRASQLGRKVTIVERESLGGVCLNWGCIPSKALLRSAQLCHDIKRSSDFGLETSGVKVDFPKIIKRSRDVAGKLSNGVSFLMKKNKIEILNGNASLDKGNLLNLTAKDGKTQSYQYQDIIIATGARPRPLPSIDVDGEVIHTYRTILEHQRLPQKMLVIGAGAIGVEFAYFFNSLGVQVTLCEMVDQILPIEDTEVADNLKKNLVKQGINIYTGVKVEDIKKSGKTVSATIAGDEKISWSGDTCLVSVGVIPNTDNIGLEKVGINMDRGFVKVDSFLKTNVDHHFAIGDCAGGALLAHKASHEGIVAAEAACGQAKHGMDYSNIPSCTYCQPQVASIGLTERALKEKGIKYKVGKIPFSAVGKAIAIGEPEGFTKVLISEDVGEILGVHILHSEATELIGEATLARTHEAIASSVVDTIHAHPTLSESIMEAMALAQGRPINF